MSAVRSTGGFYLIGTEQSLAEVIGAPPAITGLDLHARPDLVYVMTLNEDEDQRVEVDASFCHDGEPTDLLHSLSGGWEHVRRAEVTASAPLAVATAQGEPVTWLTPHSGRFGLLLLARKGNAITRGPREPYEQHLLFAWEALGSRRESGSLYEDAGGAPRFRVQPGASASTAIPLDPRVAKLRAYVADGCTPLVRTDFSDDSAWARIVRAAMAPVDFGGDGSRDADDLGVGDNDYVPNISAVDDSTFEGITGDSLGGSWPEGDVVGYVLLADRASVADLHDLTLIYVDLYDQPGRSFRCAVSEIASIEANLAIANMDFEDFADSIGPDGVFRGFPSS